MSNAANNQPPKPAANVMSQAQVREAGDTVDPAVRKAAEALNVQVGPGAEKAGGKKQGRVANTSAAASTATAARTGGTDKLLKSTESDPKKVAKALENAVNFSDTVPALGADGKMAKGTSTLMGLMDATLDAAHRAPGAKPGIDKDTAKQLLSVLKSSVDLRTVDGKAVQLDATAAKSVINDLQNMAKNMPTSGKFDDKEKLSLYSMLFRAMPSLSKVWPQKSPAYQQLVSGVLQLRSSDKSPTAMSSKELQTTMYSDIKTNLGPLMRFDPHDTGSIGHDSGTDTFQKTQGNVREGLKSWVSTLQIYRHANLGTGDTARIDNLIKAVETKIDALKGLAAPSDAKGSTFGHVIGTLNPEQAGGVVLPYTD